MIRLIKIGKQSIDSWAEAKKRTKGRMLFVLLLAALMVSVCFLPLPRSIHVNHESVEWRCGKSKYSKECTVSIDGIYFDFWFRNDFFDGSFVVSGYPETQRELTRVTFYEGMGTLFYITEDGMLEDFGWIVLRPDDGGYAVGIHEDNGWNGDSGLMLTGPAANREEAVCFTNALCRKYVQNVWNGWTFE